jgi:hypothetical protein
VSPRVGNLRDQIVGKVRVGTRGIVANLMLAKRKRDGRRRVLVNM